MDNEVVPVAIKGIFPTSNGCIIFLGPEEKTFIITVDQSIGQALGMALQGTRKERPLTHDLLQHVLVGLGAEVSRIVINDVSDAIFYARIFLQMENELGKKIIEIDARPSDAMTLAALCEKPVLVAQKVLDAVDDMTEVLERMPKNEESE